MGYSCGPANTTGTNNVFAGYQAGNANIAGSNNAYYGYRAGTDTTSDGNTLIGCQAGDFSTTGSSNTCLGYQAGLGNVSGARNTMIGAQAGYNNSSSDNLFVGYSAGYTNGAGTFNTFIGDQAGFTNSAGINNTCLGYEAGYGVTGSSNVFIGYNAGNLNGLPAATSGALVIANSGTGAPLIFGNFTSGSVGLGTTAPSSKFDLEGGSMTIAGAGAGLNVAGTFMVTNSSFVYTAVPSLGVAGTALVYNAAGLVGKGTSSLRFKKNVRDLDTSYESVLGLRPVRFQWKQDSGEDVGLIAEEVAGKIKDLVTYDNKGLVDGVKYEKIGVFLLVAIKEQQKQIEELKKLLLQSKENNEELKAEIKKQNDRLDALENRK